MGGRGRRSSPSAGVEVDEDTVLEEETSLRSTLIDDLSMPEDDFEDDDEDFFMGDDEAFLDDFEEDDEGLSPPVQSESTEEINLKEAEKEKRKKKTKGKQTKKKKK